MLVEALIISILIFFQSIFGVGLLLFGTPTFLFLNYSFLDTLNILLPISVSISFLQLIYSEKKNLEFKNNFNLFTLPFLVFSLLLFINFVDAVNIEVYISILIIIFSILSLNKKKINFLKKVSIGRQKFLLSLLGVIHGLSNLGGSLLTILSSVINKDDKIKTRFCISYGYTVMGVLQLLILYFFSNSHIKINNLLFILLVFIIYFPSQKVFHKFNGLKFSNYLNMFALFYGVFIFIKHI